MVVIVDYGMGNLRTVAHKLEKVRAAATVSGEPAGVGRADKLILPGVGSFEAGMTNLRDRLLLPVLTERVLKDKIPILGICLGMQLFTRRSEEGNVDGLGWIAAETRRFEGAIAGPSLKIPHMGWNTLDIKKVSPLLDGMTGNSKFYFLHSYYVSGEDDAATVATTRYGATFVSVLQKGNIFGVQFHPETSHQDGLSLLKNFIERC